MRKISKTEEPPEPLELTQWKRNNTKLHRYDDLDKSDEGKAARQKINERNIEEQFGLCAYCCKRIDKSNSMNEHLEPRSKNHQKELDFSNIVASCTTRNQCDDTHKSQDLPLTPLMPECETELQFFLSGDVKGKTARATTTIEVLRLDNRSLKETRKQLIAEMLICQGVPPDDLPFLEDDMLLSIMLEDLKQPKENLLEPFSPVLVNVLQQYLINREI
jgi:uncharacterized protein (TIGR02646 family)